MTQTVRDIVDAALALSTQERADTATRLIHSLGGPLPDAAEQAEMEAAWVTEIARRVKEIDDGTAELIDGDKFRAKLRARSGGSAGHEDVTMTQAVNNVLGTALALSAEERAEIVSRLIESLDGPSPAPEEQGAIDAAWDAEIERRVKEIDDGTAELVDADEVFASARSKLAALRRQRAK